MTTTSDATNLVPINENLELTIPFYGIASFYGETLQEPRGLNAFIKNIEKAVRTCHEYSRYRTYLFENFDMEKCSILRELSEEEIKYAELELHHYPLTLYDIVEIFVNKAMQDNTRLTTMSIANTVVAMHWRGVIGLVPLLKTFHEAVHANQLQIDPRWVYGDWVQFLRENTPIPQHIADKLRLEYETYSYAAITELNTSSLMVSAKCWSALAPNVTDLLTTDRS